MPITHAFTSTKTDDNDASLVRPSDWNAEHTVTDLEVDSDDINFTSTEVVTATTLTANHYLVKVRTSGGNITITLPAISSHPDREYTIIKTDSTGNTVKIVGIINGEDDIDLTLQYQFITIHADDDGDEWLIIGGINVKLEELLIENTEVLQEVLNELKDIKLCQSKAVDLEFKEE